MSHSIGEAWYVLHRALYAVLPAALGFKLFQQTSKKFGNLAIQFSALSLEPRAFLRRTLHLLINVIPNTANNPKGFDFYASQTYIYIAYSPSF